MLFLPKMNIKINPMKKTSLITLISTALLFTACNSQKTNKDELENESAMEMVTDTTNIASFDAALVDNKKDPTCGMPTTAGISDTAHYDKKVFGFCSSECKYEFLKNPKGNISAAELKK
jgi:YHS domain-containing protein